MHMSMSPNPRQREGEPLLKQSIATMRRNGSHVFAVKGLLVFCDPEGVVVPGSGVRIRPDILATAPDGMPHAIGGNNKNSTGTDCAREGYAGCG